jgi:hypothetical protein
MIERYPGTSGRTQGDRNETKPAKKAAKTETLSIDHISLPYYRPTWHAVARIGVRP